MHHPEQFNESAKSSQDERSWAAAGPAGELAMHIAVIYQGGGFCELDAISQRSDHM